MIQDRISWFQTRLLSFVTGHYRELGAGVVGLALGLTFAWLVWPVKWQGALPAEMLPEYRILIANSIAEDQLLLAQPGLNPGAEKILGYLSTEGSLPAVNEVLALLRDDPALRLEFAAGEKEQIEANLLSLQSRLIELQSTPDLDSPPITAVARGNTQAAGPVNQWTRFLSWFSILVLVGGCIWISYRMIIPRTSPAVETVRFNSDMEVEEYEEEEEADGTISSAFWSRLRRDRTLASEEPEDTAPYV